MTRRLFFRLIPSLLALVLVGSVPTQAAAESRLIVRVNPLPLLDNLTIVQRACSLAGCTVLYGLDGSLRQLYLVSVPDTLNLQIVTSLLSAAPGIAAVEADRTVFTEAADATTTSVPPALLDKDPVPYYGTNVRGGYVHQPAFGILGLAEAHDRYNATGRGITVAVIDTGVDPTHPVLSPVLLPGYDFTRNRDGGSERDDVNQSTMTVLDQSQPGWVNQSTMAVLDQSTMAVLDGPEFRAFGHGTIVAGVIHLAAPRANILPLKAFRADGSGTLSDVLRALYRASFDGAKVINMSFSFDSSSRELQRAIDFVTLRGAIAVASAGNDGQRINVYPASYSNVMGVAATTDWDVLSDFSNYGPSVAWVAAPGEAIVSTYPFGSWAAAWGTSFSSPLAAGTAALIAETAGIITNAQAADTEGNGVWISSEVAKGRVHVPTAIRAWRSRLGLF